MGLGRRMKKQGPPPPLDESKISVHKKRKAGDSESKAERPSDKKRRKAEIKRRPEPKGKSYEAADGKPVRSGNVAAVKSANRKKKSSDVIEWNEETNEELSHDEFEGIDAAGDELGGNSTDGIGSEQKAPAFDDESIFDSDEDGCIGETVFSDEDISDAEEKLTAANMEGLSRKLDQQKAVEDEQAKLELQESTLQTNISSDRPDALGDGEAAKSVSGVTPDMQLLRTRITDTIRILGDLPKLSQPDKSRADYMQQLLEDICIYYGYTSFLAEKLLSLFTPMEAFAFFEANETPRPVVIRTNTLKTNRRTLAQALINRGVVLEPVGKWSKVGLQVFESAVPLGATPEYLAGHYILQAASSFLPVIALAPQPNERILDMAAAPGGKTTYISALMRNTGCIIANDASKARAKGLIGNIHRLGCKNTIVSCQDARTVFPKALGGFDRVILDAPCTGTGVISKDPSVKTSKTARDFLAIPHMQKQLLLAAIDSTDHSSKTGGYIVYSTCSVTVEENEQVVQYALHKRPNVKIVDTGLGNFGSEGFRSYMTKKFDERMALARRYFPHRENVDGFFVCKLIKTGPSKLVVGAGSSKERQGENEIIEKKPVTEEGSSSIDTDSFGPFDNEGDTEIIARAERNRLRRKGVNPKAVGNKPKSDGGDLNEKSDSQNKLVKSISVSIVTKVTKEKASNSRPVQETKSINGRGGPKKHGISSSTNTKKARKVV
ncbi:NOL1/NOP2/sun family domain containing protein [Elaphomyces granulatus]